MMSQRHAIVRTCAIRTSLFGVVFKSCWALVGTSMAMALSTGRWTCRLFIGVRADMDH